MRAPNVLVLSRKGDLFGICCDRAREISLTSHNEMHQGNQKDKNLPCRLWCIGWGLRLCCRRKLQSYRWKQTSRCTTCLCSWTAGKKLWGRMEAPDASQCCKILPMWRRNSRGRTLQVDSTTRIWNIQWYHFFAIYLFILPSSSSLWKMRKLWVMTPWSTQFLHTCPPWLKLQWGRKSLSSSVSVKYSNFCHKRERFTIESFQAWIQVRNGFTHQRADLQQWRTKHNVTVYSGEDNSSQLLQHGHNKNPAEESLQSKR